MVRLIAVGTLLIGLMFGGPFPTSAAEALGPVTQQAMERGLAAAKQEQWQLAIKYFNKAAGITYVGSWSGASGSRHPPPVVVFNLALAYDKSGGAPLLAAIYYNAYLASAPGAKNAEQVRARVNELAIKYEATIWDLIGNAEEFINLLSRQTDLYIDDVYRAMGHVIAARVWMGDANNAKNLADTFRAPDGFLGKSDLGISMLYEHLCLALTTVGDYAGAEAALKKWVQPFPENDKKDRSEQFQEWKKGFVAWRHRLETTDWKDGSTYNSEVYHWMNGLDLRTGIQVWGARKFRIGFSNWPAFWQRIKDEEPLKLALILGETVHYWASEWLNFQRLETLWNKRRAQAQ